MKTVQFANMKFSPKSINIFNTLNINDNINDNNYNNITNIIGNIVNDHDYYLFHKDEIIWGVGLRSMIGVSWSDECCD